MASNTPNLNLLKKNPVTDGNETFNIQTMLNDNWDKIDEAVGNISVPAASLTQAGIAQLSNATDSVAEDRAATPKAVKVAYDKAVEALTAAGSGTAAEITVADAGGYYAGSTVEAALQEVGAVFAGSRTALIESINALLGS